MYQSGDGAEVFDIAIDAGEASSERSGAESAILFPNKDVLFTAEYRRSGSDLLLVTDEKSAVILDYFRNERRGLITQEGAGLSAATIEKLTLADAKGVQVAQAAGQVAAAIAIGRVEKVQGSAIVLRNGVPVELHLGDMVAKGDVVQTSADSSLVIKFTDGTVFSLSSSARMVLNDMVYAADSNANSAMFTLVQGIIGFVAGRVARTGDLKVDTPVATMAIRGTAIQTEIAAFSGTTKFSLLTEPSGVAGSFLLLDRNNPSRVIASITDAGVATLLTPVAGADPLVSQITKTPNDLLGEGTFVRDLFQFVTTEFRRKGSGDFEEGPTNLADLIQRADFSNQNYAFTPFGGGGIAPPGLVLPDLITPPSTLSGATIQGAAVEDGPLVRVAIPADEGSEEAGTLSRVQVPDDLPAGVRYLPGSRSFSLDPAHPAYQHLGVGETQVVTIRFNLLDEDGEPVASTLTWTVTGRNDAPVAASDHFVGVDDRGRAILGVRGNDRDVDGDFLEITHWTQPLGGSVFRNKLGQLVFDPGDDFAALRAGETAAVSFDYTVSDGHGGTDTATTTLQVVGRNDAPVAADDRFGGVNETGHTILDVLRNDGDVEGDLLEIIHWTAPPEGSIFRNELGQLVFDPGDDFAALGGGETATVSFNYTISDGNGGTDTATTTLQVVGRNDAPVAADDHFVGVNETGHTILDVRGNDRDVDGDLLDIIHWTAPLEGSVFRNSLGQLVFDPGDDFEALSIGETATVSFSYTISDGHGGSDTAGVTLQVQGDGKFTAPQQTDTANGVVAFNGQPVSLTLATPTATTTTRADLALALALGPLVQPQMNILYLIDISGSTSEEFEGGVVGDLNGDGDANTIIDAEIAGLIALTDRIRALGFSPEDVSVTVIPFNSEADPAESEDDSIVDAATFSLGGTGEDQIANYLRSLNSDGLTNFSEALRAANGRLAGLDQGGEQNFVYFLSDGEGQGSFAQELGILNNVYHATITAVGVGENASLTQLNQIDNTDGATLLTIPDHIDTSVLGVPLTDAIVADLDIFVNGLEIAGIEADDLIATPNGFVLDMSIEGLRRIVGEANSVSAVVTFESGEVLTTELDIAGMLPRSTDHIL